MALQVLFLENKDFRDMGAMEVTSSAFFKNGIEDPEGVFSPSIFGILPEEKETRVGFVDLKEKFIHPLILARIFQRSMRKIDNILKGTEKFIVDNGKLVPDENGKTGIRWFYSIVDQLDIFHGVENDTDSLTTIKLKKTMKKLTKEDIFVSRWLICPLAYRDISSVNVEITAIDELNILYQELISKVQYFEMRKSDPLIDLNPILYSIQMKLLDIFEYAEAQTFKKYGIQNKGVIARNTDYASRLIISAPKFDHNNFGNNWLDIHTAGVPLSSVASNCILFALHNSTKVISDLYETGGFEYKGESMPLDELLTHHFNKEHITELIDVYCGSWGERLNTIFIPETEEPIKFKYKDKNGVEKVKPLTLIEFVYLLVYEPVEINEMHTMLTRYPAQGAFSVISLKIHILTVNKTMFVDFNGMQSNYFPDIAYMLEELNLSLNKNASNEERIIAASHLSKEYCETMIISNLLIEGFGADRIVPITLKGVVENIL